MSKKDSLFHFSLGASVDAKRAAPSKPAPSSAGREEPEHAMRVARAGAKRAIEKRSQPMTAEQIKALFAKKT